MQQGFLSKQGFTLSELLVASGIMAFVLAGLLHLFITCIFLNEANRNLSIATVQGQYILEEIKNTNFANFKTGVIDADTYWDWDSAAIETSADWVDVGEDRLDISLTVSWRDFGIRQRSLVLRTLITEP